MKRLFFLILIIPLLSIGCATRSISLDQQLLFEKDDIIASLEEEIEEFQVRNQAITMTIMPLGRVGETYRYRTVLKEERGIDIHIDALVRGFTETGYVWTGDRDYLLGHVGSFTVPANGRLVWETAFDLSPVTAYFQEHGVVTYRESWYGMDAEGNTIGVSSFVSTDAF